MTLWFLFICNLFAGIKPRRGRQICGYAKSIRFLYSGICAAHLAKEQRLMKESGMSVKQILVLQQSDGGDH